MGKPEYPERNEHQLNAATARIAIIKTRRGSKVEVCGIKLPTKLVGRVRGKTTHTHTHTHTNTHTHTLTHRRRGGG